MIIAVDFDGTVVDHRYPEIGADAPGAVDTLRALVKDGHDLILFTMRSGYHLGEAIEWFKYKGIHLHGIQYNPSQHSWSQSNKCYAQLYIDDAAFGCPLIQPEGFERPCVDWSKVRESFSI
jgi:hydroxymethylpyrimidine pyrophosphatase-like HAD family hydrolase